MATIIDEKEFTIPQWAVYGMYYGVNEDDSLSDTERRQIENFIIDNDLVGYDLDFQDDEHFTLDNDLNDLASNCVTLIARRIE
jgi:hypothetical protein